MKPIPGWPDWTLGGAVFSDEIERWEEMMGQLSGREPVVEAMRFPLITDLLDALWVGICTQLKAPEGINPAVYVESLKSRFRTPALKHRTAQIALDGSKKLSQRLLAPLRERLAAGLASPAMAMAIAAWMHYVAKIAHTPGGVLDDPLAEDLLARVRSAKGAAKIVDRLLAEEGIFGPDLPAEQGFRAELLKKFTALAKNSAFLTAPQIKL